MADETFNEANEAADNLRDAFSDLYILLDDLAKSLSTSSKLTNDLADNMLRTAENTEKAKEATEDLKDDIDKATKAQEKQNKRLKLQNQLVAAGKGSLLAIVQAIQDADKQTTELVRSLALSKGEAIQLKQEFTDAAFRLNDIAITSKKLIEANNQLNNAYGTAFRFNTRTLATFSKLTKIVGITEESATNLAFAAQQSGQSFRAVEENILGASRNLQKQVGVALDSKNILESTGKITGQIRANFRNNPVEIAKAVTQAKLLGTELEKLSAAGRTLLDFESSIEKELEAELLTGKQLNLEKARSAALAGDELTLGAELAKNIGTQAEFLDMNVLEREKLAAAVGLEADQVADMLFAQETMGMNARQLRAIGKGQLADRVEELSLQDKLQAAQEKFQDSLQQLAIRLTPIVEGFASVLESIANSGPMMSALVTAAGALATISIASSIANIFSAGAKGGLLGLGVAAAAVIGMMSMISNASSTVANLAEGGVVMPRAGGTIARIGEAGQPEAVIPLNRARQMGFGDTQTNTQPIIIQNNWDAFAASNGNGRRGLGGTQALQASPTFA
jgi:hypothetical protein